MEDDYKSRVEANLLFIANLRSEIDELRTIYNEKKKQNQDLLNDFDRHRGHHDSKQVELLRVKNDLEKERAMEGPYQQQHKSLRDGHLGDIDLLNQLQAEGEQRSAEVSDHANRARSLEYELQKAQARTDDLSRIIDQKHVDLKMRNQQLAEARGEHAKHKNHHDNLVGELKNHQMNEERFRQDNAQLQKANDDYAMKNAQLQSKVRELDAQAKAHEDQLTNQKKELEGARFSNNTLLDTNSNMQTEIEALNAHIKVLNSQNDDLNGELQKFVEANEAIRSKLDRRVRVEEMRVKNDGELTKSMHNVAEARSPVRRSPYKSGL